MFRKNKKNNPPNKPPKKPFPDNPPDDLPDFFTHVEVNILSEMKTIDCFNIAIGTKKFTYPKKKENKDDKDKKTKEEIKSTTYKILDKAIYLVPTKKGFIPTIYYEKGKPNPLRFENKNKGIPSRALHLLWNPNLYRVLVALEGDRTNLLVIILLFANLVLYGITLYLKYGR